MKKEKKEKKKKEPPSKSSGVHEPRQHPTNSQIQIFVQNYNLACPPDCQCRCHKEKSVTEVAIDMALLTANANQVLKLS